MGSPSIPPPPTPGQAATAQTGTTTANEILNIAGAPITSYADVIDQLALDPEFQQLQSAMQARSGLQGAQAQRETLAEVNPQAYENQQMLGDMSSQRLSKALGMPLETELGRNRPGQAPFNVPDTSQLPNLQFMTNLSNQLARALPNVILDKNGSVVGINPGQQPESLADLIGSYSSRPNQIPTNADRPLPMIANMMAAPPLAPMGAPAKPAAPAVPTSVFHQLGPEGQQLS